MERIGVLGTGNMGKALVRQLAAHIGNDVLWGSRDLNRAKELAKVFPNTKNVSTVSYEEAQQADIVIPALPAAALMEWAASNEESMKGKIVVDISNPFNDDFSGFTTAWGESSAERLQAILPETFVVGAFKNTFFQVVERPVFEEQQSDVLVTGDDDRAVERVMASFGPLPFRFIHAGKLANNRTIERLTLLELELAIRYETYPYIATQVFGLKRAVTAD